MKKAIWILCMTAALTGCLEKDVSHTLYIETDETVTWEVLERNVYSSSRTADDREREEREYYDLALAGRPQVGAALAEIGATGVRSEFLRTRRPYSVRVTGRFRDLGEALDGLGRAAEMEAVVTFERDGDLRILTIAPRESDVAAPVETHEGDNPDPLGLALSDPLTFVLASGKFEESEGFTIVESGRVAVLSSETDGDEPEPQRLRLVWTISDDD